MLKLNSKKLKTFIKESYKLVLISVIFIFIFNISVPYHIYNGGGIINISKRITIKNNNKKTSNINMTYVSELNNNLAALLMSYILPNVDKEKIEDKDYNSKDEQIIGKLELEESINNSKIAVFNLLNKDYKTLNHKIIVSYIDEMSETNLVIGDRITKVNNTVINAISEYKQILEKSIIGDDLKLEVINNGKKIKKNIKIKDIRGNKLTGIGLIDSFNVNNNLSIDYNFKTGEYGPSGGLMMALALYDKLSNIDIVKNRIICGTGTIDVNGKIGEIGGINYKLSGAVKNKCDIFLVPEENYKEILEKQNKYKIKIYKVNTLNEAVNILLK